jgi:hypothetical protein
MLLDMRPWLQVLAAAAAAALCADSRCCCAFAAVAADNWMQDQQATHQRNEVMVGSKAALQL